ncbi:MAG: PAS domain S-box protein [Bacteroidales bacterium]|nr:PAS domain S-box protein [Bacteroidales bacterium]
MIETLENGPQSFESEIIVKNNKKIWVNLSLKHANIGGADRIMAIIRDISEQKRAEKLIKQSELKFRSIVESSPMGIFLYQLDQHGLLMLKDANKAASKILGFDLTRAINNEINQIFPNLKYTEIPEKYKKLALHGGYWNTQQFNYQDDNIKGAFEVHAFQSVPGSTVVMFVDVTDRILAQEKIRQSEEQYRSLFDQAADGILVGTSDGTIQDANKSMQKVCGYSMKEMAGKSVNMLFSEDELKQKPFRFDLLKLGKNVITERKMRTKNGTEIYVEMNTKQLADGRLQAFFRDITERMRAEKAIRESEAKFRAIFDQTFSFFRHSRHPRPHNRREPARA